MGKKLSEILRETKKDAEDYVKNPPNGGYLVGGFPGDTPFVVGGYVNEINSPELREKYEKFSESLNKLKEEKNDETLEEFKKAVDEMIEVAKKYEK